MENRRAGSQQQQKGSFFFLFRDEEKEWSADSELEEAMLAEDWK